MEKIHCIRIKSNLFTKWLFDKYSTKTNVQCYNKMFEKETFTDIIAMISPSTSIAPKDLRINECFQ